MKRFIFTILILITGTTFLFAQSGSTVEMFNKGKLEIQKGNLKTGIDLLKKASDGDPKNLYIKYYLAKAISWQNDFEEAKGIFENIIKSSKKNDEIYWMAFFSYAQIMSWQKNYDESIKKYDELLSNAKRYSITKKVIFDTRIAKADVYSWKKDYDSALEQFNAILKDNPNNVIVLNRIAKIYFWDFQLQESKKYYQMVLEIDSINSEAKDRLKQIDDFRRFEVNVGYSYQSLTAENFDGDDVFKHGYFAGIKFNVNTNFSLHTIISGLTTNSVETTDIDKRSETNSDFNILVGTLYKFNNKIFTALDLDYTFQAEVLADFNSALGISYKLTEHIDLFLNYKFTYDELDTYETDDTLTNHMFSPGITYYFTNNNYLKATPSYSTDFEDHYYLISLSQYFAFNSYNSIFVNIFYGTGRRIQNYDDNSNETNLKSYGAALTYSHYFSTVFGIEITGAYTNSIDEYETYTGAIKTIYKF